MAKVKPYNPYPPRNCAQCGKTIPEEEIKTIEEMHPTKYLIRHTACAKQVRESHKYSLLESLFTM